MRALKDKLGSSIDEAVRGNKFEASCQLVETRNSKCAIFLGPNMDQPYDEDQVKKICKDMGIRFHPIDDDFDEDDLEEFGSEMMPGAVIENGKLVWYDMYDGTVDYYKL